MAACRPRRCSPRCVLPIRRCPLEIPAVPQPGRKAMRFRRVSLRHAARFLSRGPAVRAGRFRKDEFRYDPTSDGFLCPAGQRLHPYSSSLMRGLKKINYRNSQACRNCAIRSQCTGNQFRSVSRLENEAVLDRMQARIAQRPDILDQRRETVEHPFGSIKQWMNQGAFLMRGLEKVRGEFSLTALAYNLRRVLNIMELPKLIAALPA